MVAHDKSFSKEIATLCLLSSVLFSLSYAYSLCYNRAVENAVLGAPERVNQYAQGFHIDFRNADR